MAKLTGWLTIDRLNGGGNAIVTLDASAFTELGERNASLKIKTSSRDVIVNINQKHYEEPLIPDNIPNNQIWVKSTDGRIINSFSPNSNFDVNLIEAELRSDGWSILTFDGDITYIPSNMLSYSHIVKEVVIPKSAQYIGAQAFYDCRYLESIYIPEGVTSIGKSAFYYCISLTEITIPDSVTTINNNTFSNCQKLTSIDLGNGVTSIGDGAFQYCSKLTEITIPNSVTEIGDSLFLYCTSITEITIPDGVTSIGSSVFSNCSSLTSVTIGSGVTSIGLGSGGTGGVFKLCKSLSKIKCKVRIAPTIYGSQPFAGVASNGVLEYPSGSDYSDWLSTDEYYLGYYGWTGSPY